MGECVALPPLVLSFTLSFLTILLLHESGAIFFLHPTSFPAGGGSDRWRRDE